MGQARDVRGLDGGDRGEDGENGTDLRGILACFESRKVKT